MGWRGYSDDSRKVVFFWSQKAACTTLFRVLRDNVPDCPPDKKFFHINSKGVGACLRHIRRDDYKSVILVRHPVLRVISAYLNKFCVYRGEPLRFRENLEVFAQELHDHYCRRRGRPCGENIMSFEAFLNTVEWMHIHRHRPRRPINGHWDTQTPAYLVREKFRYDHVLRVESFDADMARLAPQLGLEFTPRQLNSTPVVDFEMPEYLGKLPARKVAMMQFGYRNFITPENLAQIERIYAADFEAFGYPLDPYGGQSGQNAA